MTRSQIEISVLKEAINNLEIILDGIQLGGMQTRQGIQIAIMELENMIEETMEDAE